MVSVHDLAYKFWPNEDMERLQRTWQHLYLDCNADRGYHFKFINGAEDAAALIAVAATDPAQIEQFKAGDHRWLLGMYNDGRSIETMAALYQYHFEDVKGAMGIITEHLLAQNSENLSIHDQALLYYIMSAATFKAHSLFDQDDLIKLADFCASYDQADYTSPNEKIGQSHFPASEAVGTLVAKLREDRDNVELLEACKAYLSLLLDDDKYSDHVEFGIEILEHLDENERSHFFLTHKEKIESFVALFLCRQESFFLDDLKEDYPNVMRLLQSFIAEYEAQPDPTGHVNRAPKTPRP